MSYSPFPPVNGAPAAAPPSQALYIAGTDGTDLRGVLLDSSGRQYVVQKSNALLAATNETITSTVTTLTETAGIDGQCVVVTLKNSLASGSWPQNVCVRVRDTTNGITTSYQNAGILANGSSAQLYFNLPVANGDTVDIDIIAPGAIGASGVNVAAVLSPLTIPTHLRADGRSLPLGCYGNESAGGAATVTLQAAVAGWRILVASASAGLSSGGAVASAQIQMTVGGNGVNPLWIAISTSGAAATVEPVQGILCDVNTNLQSIVIGASAFSVCACTWDLVPA